VCNKEREDEEKQREKATERVRESKRERERETQRARIYMNTYIFNIVIYGALSFCVHPKTKFEITIHFSFLISLFHFRNINAFSIK